MSQQYERSHTLFDWVFFWCVATIYMAVNLIPVALIIFILYCVARAAWRWAS